MVSPNDVPSAAPFWEKGHARGAVSSAVDGESRVTVGDSDGVVLES